MSLVSIYDVPCPYCSSKAGARCVVVRRGDPSDRARLRVRPHAVRRLEYLKATR